MELLFKELTEQIIGAAFEVHRILGHGFLEKVYQRAMVVELRRRGVSVVVEPADKVFFKGICVGDYAADLLVADKIVVELKVAGELNPADQAQLINELHAIRKEVGLLINFGRKGVEFKRAVNQLTLSAQSVDEPGQPPLCNPRNP
jgi:GxxExxY protein